MKRLLLITIILLCLTSVKGAVYYAINDGLFSTATNWSLTPGGTPAVQAPLKGDDILEVRVFSITGAEIAHFGPSSSSRKTYTIMGGHACYIVRVLTKDKVYSRKLINFY